MIKLSLGLRVSSSNMSDSLFKKVDWFSEFEPDIEVYFSPQITSLVKNHRLKIRKELLHICKHHNLSTESIAMILDLKAPPGLQAANISISHCPLGSVITISKPSLKIGIDLEDSSRLTPSIIRRIAASDELTNSPNPQFLFPAKEATWKAFKNIDQPQVITSISIQRWQEFCPTTWLFKATIGKKTSTGQGYIYVNKGFLAALYVQNYKVQHSTN